jgi:hypothetical protein
MYLVTLSCTMDDFPIRLLSTRTEAENFANGLAVDDAFLDHCGTLHGMDASEPVCLCIATFNEAGECVSHDVVRSMQDEPATN